ncbi:MAG TPA: flagellar hook basal-body protein [Steroidobacteraceae bacterium]|jgi:flagellar basal body rod protein FlgG
MTQTILAIANAMQAEAESLRVISQNIANAQNTAYRREIALNRVAFEDLSGAGKVSNPQSVVDLRPGTLRSTGGVFDVAIEGPGFFVVQGQGGELLTRRGDFHLDAEGQLVTRQGAVVLGTKGPIRIDTGTTPAIDTDGSVRVGDNVVDTLRVQEVSDKSSLHPAGEDAYITNEQTPPVESSSSRVRQGFLETSNVQPVNEMVELMDTMRRFEAAQHFVRGYDGMVDEAIKTLGKI